MGALILFAAIVVGCSTDDDPTAVISGSGSERGVELGVTVSYFEDIGYLLVETTVHNTGDEGVQLVPTQCGRLPVTHLARTVFQSEGIEQTGSLAVAKELAMSSQRFYEQPQSMTPRDDRLPFPEGGDCERRDSPVSLGPGESESEIYSTYMEFARVTREVGSENVLIQTDVIFDNGEFPAFTDFLSTGAEETFAGRRLRVDLPLHELVNIAAEPGDPLSDAEVFDRIVEHPPLREFMISRHEESWRHVDLFRNAPASTDGTTIGDHVRLTLVTTEHEEPLVAIFDPDLGPVSIELPVTPTKPYPRNAASAPPAATVLPDRRDRGDEWILEAEVLLGELALPSGRLVITEGTFLSGDDAVQRNQFASGTYPVTATVARAESDLTGVNERVAFVTVHGDGTPVRWETALSFAYDLSEMDQGQLAAIAVDGGTAGIASAEATEELLSLFNESEEAYWAISNAAFYKHIAYDIGMSHHVGDDLNFFVVSTGFGDGRYPMWVGLDADDNPVQFLVEFGVVPLRFDS